MKITKKTFLIISVIIACFAIAAITKIQAQTKAKEPESSSRSYKVYGKCSLRSAYLGDVGSDFYKGAFVPCEITIQHTKTGWYLNSWAGTGFIKENQFDKEVDLKVGKETELETSLGKMILDTSFMYMAIKDKDIVQASVGVILPKQIGRVEFTPGVAVDAYAPTQKDGPKRGIFLHTFAKVNVPINKDWSASAQVKFSGLSSAFGFGPAVVARQTFEVKKTLNKNFDLAVDVKFSQVLTDLRKHDPRTEKNLTNFGATLYFHF